MTIIKEATKEELIKKQMETISELQEKIRLYKFDVSKNLEIIAYQKLLINSRNQTISKVKEELLTMKKENNYENINRVLCMLQEGNNESKKYSDINV